MIPPLKPRPRTVYQFKCGDYCNINETLAKQDWSFIDGNVDIEQLVDKFYMVLYKVIETFMPVVRSNGSRSYPVWFSTALIHVIKEKSKKHYDWRRFNNPVDYADFAELRVKQKLLQTECHQAYINYSHEKIKERKKENV